MSSPARHNADEREAQSGIVLRSGRRVVSTRRSTENEMTPATSRERVRRRSETTKSAAARIFESSIRSQPSRTSGAESVEHSTRRATDRNSQVRQRTVDAGGADGPSSTPLSGAAARSQPRYRAQGGELKPPRHDWGYATGVSYAPTGAIPESYGRHGARGAGTRIQEPSDRVPQTPTRRNTALETVRISQMAPEKMRRNQETDESSLDQTDDEIRSVQSIGRRRTNIAPARKTAETAMLEAVSELVKHTRALRTDRAKPPKDLTFEGMDHEDPEKFLYDIEEFFDKEDIPHSRYVVTAKSCFRGEAKQWADCVAVSVVDWETFSERFLAVYNSTSRLTVLRRRLFGDEQADGQSSFDFITRKVALFSRLAPGMPEELQVSTIMELMNKTVKGYLCTMDIASVHRLIDAASRIESVVLEDKRKKTEKQTAQPGASGTSTRPDGRAKGEKKEQPKTDRQTDGQRQNAKDTSSVSSHTQNNAQTGRSQERRWWQNRQSGQVDRQVDRQTDRRNDNRRNENREGGNQENERRASNNNEQRQGNWRERRNEAQAPQRGDWHRDAPRQQEPRAASTSRRAQEPNDWRRREAERGAAPTAANTNPNATQAGNAQRAGVEGSLRAPQ